MEKLKKVRPFYLILLLLFYILHHYNRFFGFISSAQIILYSIILFLTGLCYFLLNFFYKSPLKASLITFCLMSFLLFFGPYHDFLKLIFAETVLSSYKVVVPTTFIIILLFTFYLNKRPDSLGRFSRYLNVLMIILCTVEVFTLLFKAKRFMEDHNLIYPELSMCNNYTPLDLPDSTKPDIFYLVFDEYTSNQTLQDVWHFDNSDVTDWLSKKGFYIIPHSKSNYNLTPFSISSVFNMNYFDGEKVSKGSRVNELQATRSLSKNETFCILEKENYLIRFIAPFNNSIEKNGLAYYFDYLSEEQLYIATFFGRFKKDILWNFRRLEVDQPGANPPSHTKKVKDLNITISKIKGTTEASIERKPKFVYGHFMVTHEPHIFDSTGRVRKDFIADNEPFKTYTQQVLYVNSIIRDLVNYIQATNKRKTVILIQGDHGYRNFPSRTRTYDFPIFNAVYLPDQDYNQFYKKMSPVNTFRVLFNHYFYQKFKLLPDSSVVVNQL